jgi:hypothetical protein
MPTGKVADILARFPGPVTLYAARRKWLLMLVVCIAFAGAGAAEGQSWTNWIGVVFFGLGAIVSALMLLPHAGSLLLDVDGFEMRVFFRRIRVTWRDASNFEAIYPVGGRRLPTTAKVVGFDHAKFKDSRWVALSKFITPHAGRMVDTYGFSAEDLASLMTQWRERARGSL